LCLAAKAVVFLGREDHGNVPVLSADHDRLALRNVQKGGKALFCVDSDP
jgi:hypothetical protein